MYADVSEESRYILRNEGVREELVTNLALGLLDGAAERFERFGAFEREVGGSNDEALSFDCGLRV